LWQGCFGNALAPLRKSGLRTATGITRPVLPVWRIIFERHSPHGILGACAQPFTQYNAFYFHSGTVDPVRKIFFASDDFLSQADNALASGRVACYDAESHRTKQIQHRRMMTLYDRGLPVCRFDSLDIEGKCSEPTFLDFGQVLGPEKSGRRISGIGEKLLVAFVPQFVHPLKVHDGQVDLAADFQQGDHLIAGYGAEFQRDSPDVFCILRDVFADKTVSTRFCMYQFTVAIRHGHRAPVDFLISAIKRYHQALCL